MAPTQQMSQAASEREKMPQCSEAAAFHNAIDIYTASVHPLMGAGHRVVSEAPQSLALQSFQPLSKQSHALMPRGEEEASGAQGHCGDPPRLLGASGRIVQTPKKTG